MSLLARTRKIHFVGIGGIGMSGLAEILIKSGQKVSGSDLSDSETVEQLRSLGAKIQKGHSREFVEEIFPDVIVYSSAIDWSNPEMAFARQKSIPIIRRAEMLAELMRLRRGVALAGSHGKTTTTGLSSLILKEAGLDPAVVIGGRFDAIGSNATWGQGQWLVAEADESDGSFLRLSPELAVVTNVDREHLNHYGTFEATIKAFEEFIDRLPFYGRAILCKDCPTLRQMAPFINKPRYWYGMQKEFDPDFWVVPTQSRGAHPQFEIHHKQSDGSYRLWTTLALSVPGLHNMLNATAAALVARELEIPAETIQKALRKFNGVARRFDRRGFWKQHQVIEDYAHHPTEIRATLAACLDVYDKAPVVVFQPHRFSRTRELWSEFASCFQGAAQVISLPIYAASEPRELWVDQYDGPEFVRNIQGVPGHFCANFEEVLMTLPGLLKDPQQPILILGAGDVSKLIPQLLNQK